MRSRRLLALVVASAVLSLVSISAAVAVLVAHERLFPGAYAETGPPGEQGPRGERGPPGPPGPVGPDAEEAIGFLESDVVDVAGTAEELRSELETAWAEIETLRSDLDDAQSEIESTRRLLAELCDAISTAYFASNSATEEMLFELYLACP